MTEYATFSSVFECTERHTNVVRLKTSKFLYFATCKKNWNKGQILFDQIVEILLWNLDNQPFLNWFNTETYSSLLEDNLTTVYLLKDNRLKRFII